MPKKSNPIMNVAAIEASLGLSEGGLSNLPGYAMDAAISAIVNVQELEKRKEFRPGLYYIVLADMMGGTKFNEKYGDDAMKIRVERFHISTIRAVGEISLTNYAKFIKFVGDATLLIFSSFTDVFNWSNRLTNILEIVGDEAAYFGFGEDTDPDEFDEDDLKIRARRVVHIGEISYIENKGDPLSLAVSQTFKIEKAFQRDSLGCTEPVLQAIRPILPGLGAKVAANPTPVEISGSAEPVNTYYIEPKKSKSA